MTQKQMQYFLPEPVMARMRKHLITGIRRTRARYQYDGFVVQGVLLTAPRSLMRRFVQSAKLSPSLVGEVHSTQVPVLTDGGSSTLSIDAEHAFGASPSDAQHVQDVGNMLSIISGLEVRIEFPQEEEVAPVMLQRRKGAVYPAASIHVVVGSSPMGDSITYEGEKACGISFSPDGEASSFPGATRGRGYRVNDSDDTCIGQVVGDSLFLFAPVRLKETIKTFTTHGDLFKKMLSCAWNAQLTAAARSELVLPISDPLGYQAVLSMMDKLLPRVIEKRLTETDRHIETLRRRYARLLSDRQQFRVMQRGFVANPYFGPIEERTKAWKVLQSIEEFSEYTWRENGLQIQTQPIVHEYEGKQYVLGIYGVRMELEGRVTLWCEHSFHPKGAAHPHISKQGVVCFGNIDFALREAAAEGRLSDAALLLAQWFRSGYEPHFADVKIEEWPTQGRRK